MDVTYENLRDALHRPEEGSVEDWCKKRGLDADVLVRVAEEIAQVGVADLRDREVTLGEGLQSAFVTGFVAAWNLIERG